jgi:hypothetical protein
MSRRRIAVSEVPMLLDVNALREAIFRKKYGDEKLKKRIAFRESRGWPLWGPNEQEAEE